jgi:hypothetical protein
MRPIVVVGCGRSGTTLLYRMLSCHRDLAWFSNLTDRWPSVPALAALSNLFPVAARRGVQAGVIPIPSEGYPLWNELTRLDGLPVDEPLSERDVSGRARALATERIRSIMRFQRKRRFVNKATRNVRRLRYVDALLDEAVFVHVLRDPRATVSSLLRVAFWPTLTVWAEGNVSPAAWVAMGGDETALAARLWASDVERALEDGRSIGSDRMFEVRYEQMIADPWGVIGGLARWAELAPDEAFRRSCHSFTIADRARSFQYDLTPAQLDTITDIAGPVAERVGYTW